MTPRALVVGETLIDEFPDRRVPAGAPLHVAAHLVTAGWAVSLVTRVGDDADGRLILEACRRLGVADSLVEVDPRLPTGITDIDTSEREHAFRVRRPAAWDALQGPEPLPDHDVIVFGSLPMRTEPGRTLIQRLIETATGRLAFDINMRPPDFEPSDLRLLRDRCWVLKANDAEADIASRVFDSEDPAAWGAEWVCITHGDHGATLYNRDGGSWRVPGQRVEVVDTVGAGDAFLAALIDGLFREVDPAEALLAADRAAADVVRHRGGLPGTDGLAGTVEEA